MPAPIHSPAPLLLVDGLNLLWAATFGFPAAIRSRDGVRELTGLFAFFALLRAIVRDDLDTTAPEVLVIFDGPDASTARGAADPRYKADRPTTREALRPLEYLPAIKDGLDACGIAWAETVDAEADDLIATLTSAHRASRPVRIMSRDADLYQLLTDEVGIVNRSRRAGSRLVTAADVEQRYGVTPAQWTGFRALSGDPSDGIPGVRGIGPKTAARLLAGGIALADLPASGRLTGATGRRALAAWGEVLRWQALIELRHDLVPGPAPSGRPSLGLPPARTIVETLGLW
ncbi:hypothetical protein GCM10010430_44570 [Kitasatospora cystarginea]|uniref:5'-3' exonuclease n=1 Tax=Kitasatospora cystarginea TaxID=58350 RepID=A0ABP5RAE3_9ACTN